MKAPTIKTLSALSSISVLALAGCTTPGGHDNAQINRTDAQDRIQKGQGRIAAQASSLTNAKSTNRPSNVQVREGLFLGDTGYHASNGNPLPARFETADGVTISLGGQVTIEEIAQAIEKVTGIRVDYSDLVNAPLMKFGGDSESGDSGGTDDSASQSSGGGESGGSEEVSQDGDIDPFLHPTERRYRIQHQGKLSDLLNYVAARNRSDWVYEGGRIYFQGPQTITYTLWALPSQISSNSDVGGGNSQVFGGSKPATVSSTMSLNYWETFEAGLKAIAPNGGAAHSLNQASGTIVVTAPRHIHKRVKTFIEAENMRLSRQVAVKLDVIAFTRDRTDNKNTTITGLLDQASRGFNIDLKSPVNSVSGGIDLDVGIVKGPLDGVNNILSALSSAGQVSVLTSTTMMAMNNTPTPMSITNDRAYLAGVTTTVSAEGDETSELQTGIVSSGLNAVVTPRIMSSGMVNLQYTLNMTELNDIVEFATDDGKSVVQLPNTSNRNFMQTVNIASGESLVIGSFDQQSTKDSGSGPFSPAFWGVGGKSEFSMQDTRVLVVMSPVVIEDQNKPTRR